MRPNLNCIQYVRRLESVVMYLFRSVLTIFVLSGFGLNLLTQLDGGLAAASTQKGLTPDAATYAAQCQRTLHSYDHDIAPEISVAAGSDCMARTFARDTSADFGAAGALLVGLVVQPAETKINWSHVAQDAGLSQDALGSALQASYTAAGICSQV